ncbi:hypothetical protein WOLCODRAFT_147203 [Wolfiporia cocos MD-104 SS10]|uniref:Cytochrome P450 n=1 Tax=Wolfiporia cocos (strain MD-104) TaxID=742152 RepID=A0A2H3J2Y2_WOLCO|nr:hypothetical protein WOLCODRAFT_147203 [Wolfiporia cocos MD-104 SS10]
MLYVSDPGALTTILLREPANFEEGSSYVNANILVFGPGISSLSGEPHRKHKRILAPAFSATEIREMLPTVRVVAAKLHNAITSRIANGSQEIDIMHWLSRATLEIIGQAGLGHSFDSLIGEERDDFGKVVNTIFPIMGELSIFRPFLPAMFSFGTPTWRRCLVDIIPFGPIKRLRQLADAMNAMSTKIYRMKQYELRTNPKLLQQIKESKDIISSLLRANLDTSSRGGLNEREVTADISLMITAATDTTATTISRILQLLSQHPDYQERLRTELRDTAGLDELPFEELNKLPLLDAVLKETLRLYPPGGLTREVQKDTVLPLYQPVYCPDGTVLSEIPLPAGTEVMVGILGCNTSKAIWGEDALEWKPERWLSPLPSSITDASIPGVYSNIMTFVGGKRSCM